MNASKNPLPPDAGLWSLDIRYLAGDAVGLATAVVEAAVGPLPGNPVNEKLKAEALNQIQLQVDGLIKNLSRAGVDVNCPPKSKLSQHEENELAARLKEHHGWRVQIASLQSSQLPKALETLSGAIRTARDTFPFSISQETAMTVIEAAASIVLRADRCGDDTADQEQAIENLRRKLRCAFRNREEFEESHSKDFCSVNWGGTLYTFNQSQAACFKVLFEAWEQGTPVLFSRYVTTEADVSSPVAESRLSDVFKGHPAWGTIIVPQQEPRGSVLLKIPD